MFSRYNNNFPIPCFQYVKKNFHMMKNISAFFFGATLFSVVLIEIFVLYFCQVFFLTFIVITIVPFIFWRYISLKFCTFRISLFYSDTWQENFISSVLSMLRNVFIDFLNVTVISNSIIFCIFLILLWIIQVFSMLTNLLQLWNPGILIHFLDSSFYVY